MPCPERTTITLRRAGSVLLLSSTLLAALPLLAQPSAEPTADLATGFEAAWARQPERLALPARRDAAQAQQRAARAWTPEPAALELSAKSDRIHRNAGAREFEAGVSVPLWLPGERSRATNLADAEAQALDSRVAAARLRLAAPLREAWWQWHRARNEVELATGQLDNARRLADDVARRTRAGDLARADQHQADGAVASAEAALAQAHAALAGARQQFSAATGLAPAPQPTAEPAPGADDTPPTPHPALRELQDRVAVAERSAALAGTQSRAHPELVLGTTRDRGSATEPYAQSLTVGVRLPFGAGPRQDSRVATAHAELAELQAQLALQRSSVQAEQAAGQARVEAARLQLAAAERRERLARETRGFFDKAVRLGASHLPTRLRIEAEATEAERQAARARIELAASISTWRQALGLLPAAAAR